MAGRPLGGMGWHHRSFIMAWVGEGLMGWDWMDWIAYLSPHGDAGFTDEIMCDLIIILYIVHKNLTYQKCPY